MQRGAGQGTEVAGGNPTRGQQMQADLTQGVWYSLRGLHQFEVGDGDDDDDGNDDNNDDDDYDDGDDDESDDDFDPSTHIRNF